MDLKKLSIDELLQYEEAAQIVCTRYENNLKMYDGSITNSGPEFLKFDKYNKLYLRIFEEIENRLNAL